MIRKDVHASMDIFIERVSNVTTKSWRFSHRRMCSTLRNTRTRSKRGKTRGGERVHCKLWIQVLLILYGCPLGVCNECLRHLSFREATLLNTIAKDSLELGKEELCEGDEFASLVVCSSNNNSTWSATNKDPKLIVCHPGALPWKNSADESFRTERFTLHSIRTSDGYNVPEPVN